MSGISIEGRVIDFDSAPYVIAEMSANHNGKIENALAIIDAAAEAGADAVKIQTFTPDTITIPSSSEDFIVRGGLWDGRTLYSLYQEAHMPWEWLPTLFDHARSRGITIFSSVFDESSVDYLEELGVAAYKIASCEIVDLPLIKYVASTGKPVIISTGMASVQDINDALEAAKSTGNSQLAVLQCVAGYPALASDYNLQTIPDMQRRFDVVVGLSDHTISNATAVASVAIGARIIEKHFTLDRNGGGPDDSFSIEPEELAELCQGALTAFEALGSVSYGSQSSEQGNEKYRRSLYIVSDVRKGDLFTRENVRSIRPGFGLAPGLLESVLGKCSADDFSAGTPLTLNAIAEKSP